MKTCKECDHVNKNNNWCIVKGEFVNVNETCVQFILNTDDPKHKCLFCKHYNILSYICTKDKSTVSAHFSCNLFENNLESYVSDNFIGIVVGGCTTYEHGTDLYKRCKEWLETIKTDDSKQKGVRVVFTRHDYPTALFWRSFIEKIYHYYELDWIRKKLCFRGLTETMINDAVYVRNSIQLES
jgi:hypothetical protein